LPDLITQAQPPLEFIPPAFNPIVYRATRRLLPLWTRWRVQLVQVEVHNAAQLVELYQQFRAGKVRFMMAFRHPSVNDPFGLFNLLAYRVPQAARQQGVPLQMPVHAHFIYDRGIPLWAGKPVGWLLSQLGGTPIRRGKVDVPALRSIRELFVNGQFPMAAAPEGATNGHTEVISPIEPGIAQFGFWCVEDLHKGNRSETVLIVPIGIRYRYVTPPWEAIEDLLSQLEADCGLPPASEANLPQIAAATAANPAVEPHHLLLYRRLLRLGAHLLLLMEQFYSKFYHQNLKSESFSADPTPAQTFNDQLAARLQRLLNAALSVAEQYFGIQAKGSLTDRCRRLEQAGWDWIFRSDLENVAQLPPVERGLADRIAEEANLRLWHMRLVESFVSVTGHYILEKPSVDRMAETLLLIWDTVTRLKGKDATRRPRLGKQRVEITIAEPLSVSDRWPAYQENRRQAVAALTQDLQTALGKTIL
jgi:hypothetical protein